MSWLNFLGGGNSGDDKLPDIFPIPILQKDFVRIDVQNIYTRILIDALERTQGIAEKNKAQFYYDEKSINTQFVIATVNFRKIKTNLKSA